MRKLAKISHFNTNNKGFTLIGVLVASVIGTIVVAGLSQMFVNMASQINEMESRGNRIFLDQKIGEDFRRGCDATLREFGDKILDGTGIPQFSKIKTYLGDPGFNNLETIYDLGNPDPDPDDPDGLIIREKLKAEHGIVGDIYFELICDDDSGSCDCRSTPLEHCEKQWRLSFVSQSEVNGVYVYNKKLSFQVSTEYTGSNIINLPTETTYAPNKYDFTCNILNILVGLTKDDINTDCILLDDKKTLVGCGSTISNYATQITALGYNAGGWSSSGANNTFIGNLTGENNTTGDDNTFVGYRAGNTNTIGKHNIFIGSRAGHDSSSGNYNIFMGYLAGRNTIGDSTGEGKGEKNIFIGHRTGLKNTEGQENLFIGSYAGFNNTVGIYNIFMGNNAGFNNTGGSYNNFFGLEAGLENTTGYNNNFFGLGAGLKNTEGHNNIFIGHQAGRKNTTGAGNIFIGNYVADTNAYETAHNKFVIGNPASATTIDNLKSPTWIEGDIGEEIFKIAGKQVCLNGGTGAADCSGGGDGGDGSTCINLDANGKTLVGCGTTQANTNTTTTAFGFDAGGSSSTGPNNVFIGPEAGKSNTTGTRNTFIGGNWTGRKNTTGSNNNFIGFEAGQSNIGGSANIFMGIAAGTSNTSGSSNIFIGHDAGNTNISGGNNTFIGSSSGRPNKGSNNIFIGSNAGNTTAYNGTESDKFVIGNSNSKTWIEGNIGGDFLTVNDNPVCLDTGTGCGGGGGGTPDPCISLSSGGKTLVGCGTTQDNPHSETTAFGFHAGNSNTTGIRNTFVGYEAGKSTRGGESNTFVGYNAGADNIGSYNTFVGRHTGSKNTTGTMNTFVGIEAGENPTSGSQNTFLGRQAGRSNSGSGNTFIGNEAGLSGTASNSIIIKAGTSEREATGSGGIWTSLKNNIFKNIAKNTKQLKTKRSKKGSNNIIIGSFSTEKEKELSAKSDYLWIKDIIQGNSYEKWVSIDQDLEAKNLYAQLNSLSDKRLKKNIEALNAEHSLNILNKIKTYSFEWKNPKEQEEGLQFGVIAQEVQTLLPEVVKKDRKGFLNVNYPRFIPLIISSLQAFQKEVSLKFADLYSKLQIVKQSLLDFKKQTLQAFADLKLELSNTDTEIKKELADTKRELSEIKARLKKLEESK